MMFFHLFIAKPIQLVGNEMECFPGNCKLKIDTRQMTLNLDLENFEKVMKIHPFKKYGAKDVLLLLRI